MFKIVNQEKFKQELVRIITIECPFYTNNKCYDISDQEKCWECWKESMGMLED